MSTWPFSDYLDVVAPHLPQELLPPTQIEAMRQQLDAVPGDWTRTFLFECRLDADDMQIDVEFIVQRGHGQRLVDCQSALFQNPIWQRVQQFAERWVQSISATFANISHIWLGFDFDTVTQSPRPVLYICTEKLTKTQILDLLAAIEQPVSDQFVACLTAAPRAPWMIGIMFARQTDALRFILPLPTGEACLFLSKIGWNKQDATASDILHTLQNTTAEVGISLDIGQTIKPRLGLEYLYIRRQTSLPHHWEQQLAQLRAWGVCSAEKEAALLQFPSLLHERQTPDCWPASLRSQNEMPCISIVERSLSHLKLIITPGRPLAAKAYLHVSQGWLQMPKGKN